MKPWVQRTAATIGILFVLLLLAVGISVGPVHRPPMDQVPAYTAGRAALAQLATNVPAPPAPISVGFGRAKLTPTLGTPEDAPEKGEFRSLPLAGYGARKGKPAEGVHDDVWVKAMAFVSNGRTGVVVCADALIVPREITALAVQQIGTQFGLPRESLYFSATHTHCSLGGWGEGPVGEAFAGPFQPAVRLWFAHQLTEATANALADLKPASVGTGSFMAPQFVRNRLVGDRGQIDPEFSLLVARQEGGRLGVLGSFAAHPTILGSDMRQFSAEYPGVWQRTMESATGGFALYAAGAVGSHSAKAPASGMDGVEALGKALADETLKQLTIIGLTNRAHFAVLGATLPLPELQVRLSENLRLRHWLAQRFLPVGQETYVQGFRIDTAYWFSTPCDFSGEIAADLKKASAAAGRHIQITSFNGDYLGYVIPVKYYSMPGYEPRTMSFFGPDLPTYLIESIQALEANLAK